METPLSTLASHVYIQEHLKKRKITCDHKGRWNTRFCDKNGYVHQIRHRTLEAMYQDLIHRYDDNYHKPTVRTVFYEWMDDRMEYREIQKGSYDRAVNDYKRFFASSWFESKFICEITEDMLIKFIRDSIRDFELTAKAWQNLKGIILGIFKYAKFKKYTSFSISLFFSDFRIPKGMFHHTIVRDEEKVFTDEELAAIIHWINDDPERRQNVKNLGILFCMFTGLRAGELSAIKFTDFYENVLEVSRTEIRYRKEQGSYRYEVRESTKGARGIRYIIVPPEGLKIIEEVRRINPDGPFVFMNDGYRVRGDRFSEKLKRICDYIEIPPRSLHCLRRTYASILIDGGCRDSLVTDQMGHTDIRTTLGHYYYRRKYLTENTEVINQVFSNLKGLQ